MRNLLRYIFLFFFLLVINTNLDAQWASVQGVISDYSTSQALEGANITIRDINKSNRFKGAATDKMGIIRLVLFVRGLMS